MDLYKPNYDLSKLVDLSKGSLISMNLLLIGA